MITLQSALHKIKENNAYLLCEYGVEKIGIFGSVAKNNATNESDIDLVVVFNQPIGFKFIELNDYLERLLDTKVDLLTQDGIDNIRIRRISDNITKNIVYV